MAEPRAGLIACAALRREGLLGTGTSLDPTFPSTRCCWSRTDSEMTEPRADLDACAALRREERLGTGTSLDPTSPRADTTLLGEDRLGDDRASGRPPRRHAALPPTTVKGSTGALADRRWSTRTPPLDRRGQDVRAGSVGADPSPSVAERVQAGPRGI